MLEENEEELKLTRKREEELKKILEEKEVYAV